MDKNYKNYMGLESKTTILSFGDYTIELNKGKKKGNPYGLVEALYRLSKDKTVDSEEKTRDLRAIVKEYMG